MQATPPIHPLSSSSVDPFLILTNPSLVLILTNPPPSTHPSSKPTYTFISFLSSLKLIVNAKHRLEPYILFSSLPPFRSTHPWLISSSPPLDQPPLTQFQPSFLIYLSLLPSISHSFFFPFSVWLSLKVNGFILIYVSLKSLYLVIFYYKICLEVEKMAEKI